MPRNHQPLTDRECEETSRRNLELSYQALRGEYEDVLALLRQLERSQLPKGSPMG